MTKERPHEITTSKEYPVCVVPPEQHYDSYHDLIVDMKHYEQSRAYFYKEHPQMAPPEGKFEIVKISDGKGFILLPTKLDRGVIYRGQGCIYNPCLPTLFRQPRTKEEIFVEQVRIAEFRLLLEQYGVTKKFEHNHFNIDYVGLAQHYGLNTPVLDFTSDVEIALFFAMCDYDNAEDCYKPKREDKEYVGYIYAKLTHETSDKRNDNNPFGTFSGRVKVIGVQPFKRPGVQRGFSFDAGSNGLQNAYLYSFSYTKKDSEDIYRHFHNGADLWCKDEITGYAKKIKETKTFSSQAVSLATKMFDRSVSIGKRINRLKQSGFNIVGQTKLDWWGVGHPCNEKEWYDIRKDFVQRQTISGDGKRFEYSNTIVIGQELIFNYIYGCTDCPKGYDSGITLMIADEHTFGLQTERNHSHLILDEVDGKVHPKWKKEDPYFKEERSFAIPGIFKTKLVKK